MAITRIKTSGVYGSKYNDALAGLPAVMAAPTATDGGTGSTALVAFTAQSGATSYTAISTPGSFTGTGASSPVTVSGLTAGTAYTFQILATNTQGTGAYSAASNSITPVVPSSYESIATLNGAGLGFPTVTFSSIPQTYKHLQLRIVSRNTFATANPISSGIYVNGLTTNYYQSAGFYGQNGIFTKVNTAGNGDVRSGGALASAGNSLTASYYGVSIIDIHNYSDTTNNKSFTLFGGVSTGTTATDRIAIAAGSSMYATAITSISIVDGSGSGFTTDSVFALYGIKGA